MSENNKSSTFSSYSGAGATLKNITSDMWEPITTSGNYTAYTPPKKGDVPKQSPRQNQRPTQQSQKIQRGQAKASSTKEVQKPKSERTKLKNESGTKKGSAKVNSTERQPISTMPPPQSATKAKTKKKRKKTKNQKIKPMSKRTISKSARQCEKNNKAFVRLIKNGKTTDEARRIIYLRKLRRRRLGNIGSVAFISLFAFIFVFTYTYFEGARVDTIVVGGDEVYSRDEILDAAKLSEGVNMLTVRQNAVNDSVTKTLPFVSAIKLDYDLPDTLKLNVISTTERLIIKNGSKYICVDKTGKVVSEKKKKLSEGTFLVEGMKQQQCTVGEMFTPTDENAERFKIVLLLAQAAENNETVTYGIIDVEDIENITLTYNSKLRLYFGDGSNLQSKMTQAEKVIADNDAINKVGYVNVKYSIGAYYMQGTMECD